MNGALERVNHVHPSLDDQLLLLHAHMLAEERDRLVHDMLIFRLELQARLAAADKRPAKRAPRAQSLITDPADSPAADLSATSTSVEASPRQRMSLSQLLVTQVCPLLRRASRAAITLLRIDEDSAVAAVPTATAEVSVQFELVLRLFTFEKLEELVERWKTSADRLRRIAAELPTGPLPVTAFLVLEHLRAQYEMLRRYTKVLLRIETRPTEVARLSEPPLSLAELALSKNTGRGSLEKLASSSSAVDCGKGVEDADALHSKDKSLRDRRRQHLERSAPAQKHTDRDCRHWLEHSGVLDDSPQSLLCTSSTRHGAKGQATCAALHTSLSMWRNKSAEKLVAQVRGGFFWHELNDKLRGVAKLLLARAPNAELNALGDTRVKWLECESDSSASSDESSSDSENEEP